MDIPLLGAIERPKLWATLGWHEIVQNYRRTFFGPFWITLNMAIFALAMTLVYSALFGVSPDEYSAYVVCSMMIWWWVMGLLNESGGAFLNNSQFIRCMPCDTSTFIWASAFKQVVVLAHHSVVFFALVIFGLIKLSFYTPLVIVSITIVFFMSVPLVSILAILYVRYRDLQRLIGSATIILMMVTPVFWKPDMLQGWRTLIYDFNPVYYIVEFVRLPLLGQPIPWLIVGVNLGMLAGFWLVGSFFYTRYHRYVVFWL